MWYTCVHICIIYISNIYYIYLYHISVEGCHGDQPQYICNSFHHPNLSCAFTQDFLVSHQKLILGRGGRRRGDMGNRLILMKSNVCVISWLRFGSMLNCENSDELMKSYLQPVEKCPVRLCCVRCRKRQSTNCSLIWSWFSFGKLL